MINLKHKANMIPELSEFQMYISDKVWVDVSVLVRYEVVEHSHHDVVGPIISQLKALW